VRKFHAANSAALLDDKEAVIDEVLEGAIGLDRREPGALKLVPRGVLRGALAKAFGAQEPLLDEHLHGWWMGGKATTVKFLENVLGPAMELLRANDVFGSDALFVQLSAEETEERRNGIDLVKGHLGRNAGDKTHDRRAGGVAYDRRQRAVATAPLAGLDGGQKRLWAGEQPKFEPVFHHGRDRAFPALQHVQEILAEAQDHTHRTGFMTEAERQVVVVRQARIEICRGAVLCEDGEGGAKILRDARLALTKSKDFLKLIENEHGPGKCS
jgi:hypothetical protein